MLMIVAHHYVVNSGLTLPDSPMMQDRFACNSLYLMLFGAWGKTGINCFLLITGYFMCTSKITLRKFVKLMAQIYCIRFLVFPLLLVGGYESISGLRIVKLLMPTWGFRDNFTGCFIAFWLTIPFLSILVQNMTRRQHQLLLLLALGCYTILGSIPTFDVKFNYITWFGIIFFIASYIRLHPHPVFERRAFWGWLTLGAVLLSMFSVVVMARLFGQGQYFFLMDSNKILSVTVAIASFLWFKNMDIPQSKIINAIGGSTFGVFLFHAHTGAGMRSWLWKDTVDAVGHYSLPFVELVLYSVGVVLAVFIVCNLLDQLRIQFLEKPFFKWYDRNLNEKLNKKINKIMTI